MLKLTEGEKQIYDDLKKSQNSGDNVNKYFTTANDFSLKYQLNHHDELPMDYHEYFKRFFIDREEIEDYSVALGNATMLDTTSMFESHDPNQLYKLVAKNHPKPIDVNELQGFIGNENKIKVLPVDIKDQKIAFHIIDAMVYQIGV